MLPLLYLLGFAGFTELFLRNTSQVEVRYCLSSEMKYFEYEISRHLILESSLINALYKRSFCMNIYRPSDLSDYALPAPETLNLEIDFTIVNNLGRALIGKILFVTKINVFQYR
jgi:hypothetical protein